MTFKDKLTYTILNKFSNFTGKLSETSRDRLVKRLASFFYYFIPIRKNQAFDNIKKPFLIKITNGLKNN